MGAAPRRTSSEPTGSFPGAAAELAERYRTNRLAIAVERDRLARLATRLRDAGGVQAAPEQDAAVNRLVRGCFQVARLVDRALDEDLLGERDDPDNDVFMDAKQADETFSHLRSHLPLVHEWGQQQLADLLSELDEGIELLTRLSADDRQVLVFDSSAAGVIVEVFGDVLGARHLAVVVPGMGTTVQNFDVSVADRARRLQRAASDHSSDGPVSVLGWLGYKAPGGLDLVDAAAERLATEGAEALSAFVSDLDRGASSAHCSVVAHSYGSVVAGLAAHAHGLPVEELVVMGSPGLGVSHVRDLRINPDGRVWAVRARHDPITEVPSLQIGAVRLHGTSPYDDGFGSFVVAIDDEGHSSYLDGEHGVGVIARIIVGDDPRVVTPRVVTPGVPSLGDRREPTGPTSAG